MRVIRLDKFLLEPVRVTLKLNFTSSFIFCLAFLQCWILASGISLKVCSLKKIVLFLLR